MFMCVVRWKLGEEVLLELGLSYFPRQWSSRETRRITTWLSKRRVDSAFKVIWPSPTTLHCLCFHPAHRIIDSSDFCRTLCSVIRCIETETNGWVGHGVNVRSGQGTSFKWGMARETNSVPVRQLLCLFPCLCLVPGTTWSQKASITIGDPSSSLECPMPSLPLSHQTLRSPTVMLLDKSQPESELGIKLGVPMSGKVSVTSSTSCQPCQVGMI